MCADVGLLFDADGRAAHHFEAEYGRAPQLGAPPVMQLLVAAPGRRLRRSRTERAFRGGHRLAQWRVRVRLDDSAIPVSCRLQVAGPLGLLLVQSMVVEPLLSLATPAAGRVLLPAALVECHDGPVLVLGGSGSGKSTLALRALACGRAVAADDQILVAGDGACAGLSRRLRVYHDLPSVVPQAHALLPPAIRRRVWLAGHVNRLSAGRVSPPVAVSPALLAPARSRPGRDLRPVRAVLLATGRPQAKVSQDELLTCALELLAEQRVRLLAAGLRPPAATIRAEQSILEAALAPLDAERVDARNAADPLAALERAVSR
ncbi:MAG: hypothetical protein KY463_06725 [Actinobacteria bacterium]|nr:hypothetical protein [Actinomycetota bacterium]